MMDDEGVALGRVWIVLARAVVAVGLVLLVLHWCGCGSVVAGLEEAGEDGGTDASGPDGAEHHEDTPPPVDSEDGADENETNEVEDTAAGDEVSSEEASGADCGGPFVGDGLTRACYPMPVVAGRTYSASDCTTTSLEAGGLQVWMEGACYCWADVLWPCAPQRGCTCTATETGEALACANCTLGYGCQWRIVVTGECEGKSHE